MLAGPTRMNKCLPRLQHLVHHLTGQVDGREPRHPDIAARQRATGQCLPQRGRGVRRRCHPRACVHRSRSPRGVRAKPASATARSAAEPTALGLQYGRAVDALDKDRVDAPGSRPGRRGRRPPRGRRGSSSVKVSSERPPRSRNHASSPSTSTTSAPGFAARPGAGVAVSPAGGQGSAAPYGLAGSAAASTTARYSRSFGSTPSR